MKSLHVGRFSTLMSVKFGSARVDVFAGEAWSWGREELMQASSPRRLCRYVVLLLIQRRC